MLIENGDGQMMLFDPDWQSGKMYQAVCPAQTVSITNRCSNRSLELKNQTFMLLDLRPGAGNMLGPCWEIDPVWLGCNGTLNTTLSLRGARESLLSSILLDTVPYKYYLTSQACLGILRRARERGKPLPPQLEAALKLQAGIKIDVQIPTDAEMTGCLTPWDTQQTRIFSPEGTAPTVTGADGGGGRNPAGLVYTAGFCAGASPTAGSIGYHEDVSPTLKGAESGTNQVPAVICLNDEGGNRIDLSSNVTGTLRSQDHGHEPLILDSQAGGDSASLFENHGIDTRYQGPLNVAPTISARYGTGGNNAPLVKQPHLSVYCITSNAIDRQPQNGGNGMGYQEDIAYTLTATDKHAIYARQRIDLFKEDDLASTESARQHKDATDLVYQEIVTASNENTGDGRPLLIRRLMPSECELLQGYPLGWTDIPNITSSDSARYRALGNSVAVPCVQVIMEGIVLAMEHPENIWSL